MSKIFNLLNTKYASLDFPESSLSALGVDRQKLNELTANASGFALAAGIPNWIHSAITDILSYSSNVYSVAKEEGKYVAVEKSNSNSDQALILKYEASSNKILEVLSTIEVDATWVSLFTFATMFRNDKDMAELMDALNVFASLLQGKEVSEEETTKAYFKVTSKVAESIFDLEDNVVLNSSGAVRTITREVLNATDEYDNLVCQKAFQSVFAMDCEPDFFTFFSPKSLAFSESEKVKDTANKSYIISEHRKFTEDEQEMMANTAMRMPSYIPSKEALDLVGAFYATNKAGFGRPLRAALLYGESGTGKTEMVQYLGFKLGLPVTTFQCSANTDENDLLGKPISLGLSGGDGKISYTETELVRAVKNGWIIEIQEAASVKETAVLQIFNALLDGTELLQLPDGRQLTPHPNFIMVFTTNVSYEGCNALNQSLISRNQFVREVALPSDEEFAQRLASQLSWPDKISKTPIKEAIKTMHKIKEYLKENYLMDGSCDFRAVKDWLQLYLAYNEVGIPKTLLECSEYTVIPKATLDNEHHDAIRAICAALISV